MMFMSGFLVGLSAILFMAGKGAWLMVGLCGIAFLAGTWMDRRMKT